MAARRVAQISNDRAVQVDYRVPTQDFLSKQQLADLNAGKPVPVRFSLHYRAVGTAFTVRGETPLGYQLGGSYSLMFTLRN